MSLHADLLRQARQLARKEPRRPLQASLRRAPSMDNLRVVLRSLSPARRRGNDTHVFRPRSDGSARLRGTCVRPRRHEESGPAVLGRWSFSEAQPRDERPSSPTGARCRCGDIRRPSAGARRSRLRHDSPIHAIGRDPPGGPCGAGIPGLEHRAKKRSGRRISRRTAHVREHTHLRTARHNVAGVVGPCRPWPRSAYWSEATPHRSSDVSSNTANFSRSGAGSRADEPPLRIDVHHRELDGAAFVLVAVPRGEALHERGGRAFIRVGATRRRLRSDEIPRLAQNRAQSRYLWFDKQTVPETGFETLSERLWEPLLSVAGATDPRRGLTNLRLLARDEAGVYRATVASILLCAASPQDWLSQATIAATHYRGLDRASGQLDAREIAGPRRHRAGAADPAGLRRVLVRAGVPIGQS